MPHITQREPLGMSEARLRSLLGAAALLFHSASAEGVYGHYDLSFPTGMYLEWNSSSGASGTVMYAPGTAGTAVPDEGNGGLTSHPTCESAAAAGACHTLEVGLV